ncbi:hypothetical protein BSKO_05353 [Bryopsis sp. KO-2023]|nr:hypothetical protein BSKO_05353 [Bryopsis sp. KO-2023]
MTSDTGRPKPAPQLTEEFMLHSYKVISCGKCYPHNWKRCPFAHEGEAARRRDPRTHSYSDVMCPEARKGQTCPRGDNCPFTHSLFEYWLLPSRFKTQLCSKRGACRRAFCFFAHDESELREPPAPEGGLSLAVERSARSSTLSSMPSGSTLSQYGFPTPRLDFNLPGASLSISDILMDEPLPRENWDVGPLNMDKMIPESLLSTMDRIGESPLGWGLTELNQLDVGLVQPPTVAATIGENIPECFQNYEIMLKRNQCNEYDQWNGAQRGCTVPPSVQILKSLSAGQIGSSKR